MIYAYLILAVVVVVTIAITHLANKAKTRPGLPNALQYVAIGFWFLTIITVVVVAAIYLNTHGIHFQPKPIKL